MGKRNLAFVLRFPLPYANKAVNHLFSLDFSPKSIYNQVFLDLAYFRGKLPQHYKIQFSFEHLANNTTAPGHVQFNLHESFRNDLIQEIRAFPYNVLSPLQLPLELRSERWQLLCEYLENFSDLSKTIQIKVVHLLGGLCFHRTILRIIPEYSVAEISRCAECSSLAYLRAFSGIMDRDERALPTNLDELTVIAENAPQGSLPKVCAALQLLVLSAYEFKDVETAELWRSFLEKELPFALSSLNPLSGNLLLSNYYRAAAFLPQLMNDKEQLVEEMNLCQAHSESLTGTTFEQQFLCHENQNVILESRAKEALWLKDLDLAEERTCQLIERSKLEPRYNLELGEILLKKGQVEDSLKLYLRAARLGPPGTAIAWFMAGQCYQSIGEYELAYDAYSFSLERDPLAISPVRRLGQIAPLMGNENLAEWVNQRLDQLEDYKKTMVSEGKIVKPSIAIPTK